MHACRLLFIQSTGEVNTGDVDFFFIRQGDCTARRFLRRDQPGGSGARKMRVGWGKQLKDINWGFEVPE